MAESSLANDFGTGLACGAAGVFFLVALHWLWLHRLLPLVRRWRYPGVNIAGEWNGTGAGYTPAHGEWSEVLLSLEQDLDTVHGVVTLRCRAGTHAVDTRLRAVGQVARGYVALTLSPAGEASPSPATALLKIGERGATLEGQLLYRHPLMEVVDVVDVSVRRSQGAATAQGRTPGVGGAMSGRSDAASLPAGTALE